MTLIELLEYSKRELKNGSSRIAMVNTLKAMGVNREVIKAIMGTLTDKGRYIRIRD